MMNFLRFTKMKLVTFFLLVAYSPLAMFFVVVTDGTLLRQAADAFIMPAYLVVSFVVRPIWNWMLTPTSKDSMPTNMEYNFTFFVIACVLSTILWLIACLIARGIEMRKAQMNSQLQKH